MSTITGVIGKRGSGKTTLLAAFAWYAARARRKIRANFALPFFGIPEEHGNLKLPPRQDRDEDEDEYMARLRAFFGPLSNSLVLMSEAYAHGLDARRSGDARNLAWSYWVSETRKVGTDIALDSQSIGKVDVRIRELLDYLVVVGCLVCQGCGADGRRRCKCPCKLTPACGMEWSVIQWYEPGMLKDELQPISEPQMWLRTPFYRFFDTNLVRSFVAHGTTEAAERPLSVPHPQEPAPLLPAKALPAPALPAPALPPAALAVPALPAIPPPMPPRISAARAGIQRRKHGGVGFEEAMQRAKALGLLPPDVDPDKAIKKARGL